MAVFDKEEARARVGGVLDSLVPDASELGAVDYVENLLTAFEHSPPRIWAAPGAWSGGPGGWLELGPWEEHAWRSRVAVWTELYARVAAGDELSDDDRDVLHQHACEATYGDPAYGGNRDEGGWRRVNFPTPLFPPSRADGEE